MNLQGFCPKSNLGIAFSLHSNISLLLLVINISNVDM